MTTEDAFIVQGGTPLKGTVTLDGAKNVSLKVLIAALLFDEPVHFSNIPHLKDIRELSHLINATGAQVTFDNGNVTVEPQDMTQHAVDLLHASKIRVSFMMFAPFLHKFGKAYIPNPGGCRIGARPIDRMISLIKAFGVETTYDPDTGYYDARLTHDAIQGTEFTFPKPTHTGTELAIMMAVKAKGTSVIKNVALEPEIDDLINFLNTSGANIERKNDEIHIEGVEKLTPPERYRIIVDRNNAVTYAALAYTTQGDIFVEGANKETLQRYLQCLDEINASYEVQENGVRFYHDGPLKPTTIKTSPEPGFMTDWQAPTAIMLAQAEGTSKIYETVFENRFGYAEELRKLGVDVEFIDPRDEIDVSEYQFNIDNPDEYDFSQQAIRINGPSDMHGGVVHVTDMRAGATLLIAACAAEGESVVIGASQIDRGYAHIEDKLRAIGAEIKRV